MFDRRLKLGTFLGIGVYVHWTFALLIAYVAYAASGEGVAFMAFNILLLLHVFLCVTLHEYGHALTARKFGIPTLDITLLPIGGVARLHRMPRVPWQEFLVAVAGPAVNVAIVLVLSLVLRIFRPAAFAQLMPLDFSWELLDRFNALMDEPNVTAFLLLMVCVNAALVLFNMIPAFPMDGGRVLRSVLAMFMDYRKATRCAFGVGVVAAVMLALAAINYGAVTAGLIAVFVVFAGLTEARQVEVMERVRGLKVADVMIHDPPSIPLDTPAVLLPELWKAFPWGSVPVVGVDKIVIEMLTVEQTVQMLESDVWEGRTVGELVAEISSQREQEAAVKLRPDEKLQDVILAAEKRRRFFPVIDEQGRLIGMLDLENAASRGGLLTKSVPQDGR